MEDICKRIPDLAEIVFKNLSNQDLIKCKETSRVISSFLNEERSFAIRIINAHFGNFREFQDSWNKVVDKAPRKIVKTLTKAIQDFFKGDESKFENQWPPFCIAAEYGNKQLCEHIIERIGKAYIDGPFGLNATLFKVANKVSQRPLNTWTGRLLGFLQLLNYQRIQKVIVTSFVHLQKIHIFKKFGGRS